MNESQSAQFDQLPPHSIEAEQCLLASCILDRELIADVMRVVTRDHFYQVDHQIIWDILAAMYEQNQPIDITLLRAELIKRGTYEEIGGAAYLAKLFDTVPSAAFGMNYAAVVREKFMLRALIEVSNQTLRDVYRPHQKATEIVERFENRAMAVGQTLVSSSLCSAADVVDKVYERMIDPTVAPGLDTGYFELDDLMKLRDGEMIVVAARPSMGKTAFAMNLVENLSIDPGGPKLAGAVFSAEMTKELLMQRTLASVGEVNGKLRHFDNEEIRRLGNAMVKIATAKLWLEDSSSMTVPLIRAACRRLKMQHGLKYAVVDYLQLLDGGDGKRVEVVTAISKGLKAIAKDLAIPLIVCAQLNRGSENRDGHRPRLSDLRESGSIEQDADVVLLLHREDYYHIGEDDFIPDNLADVIIAKQRNGPPGAIKLTFDQNRTKFRNLATQTSPF